MTPAAACARKFVRHCRHFDGVYPANGRAQCDSKLSLRDAPPRQRGRAGAAAPGRVFRGSFWIFFLSSFGA